MPRILSGDGSIKDWTPNQLLNFIQRFTLSDLQVVQKALTVARMTITDLLTAKDVKLTRSLTLKQTVINAIDFGSTSITGDGTVFKDVTVDHNLGVTPTIVTANSAAADKIIGVFTLTSTQITFRVRDVTGSWSTTTTVYWIAIV